MRNHRFPRRGAVLVTTFLFMFTMAFIVTAFLDVSTAELRELKGRIEIGKAFWFAEAGLHKAQWILITPPPEGEGIDYLTPAGGVTETFDEGSYTYEVIRVTSRRRRIVSTGSYLNHTYKIQQLFNIV